MKRKFATSFAVIGAIASILTIISFLKYSPDQSTTGTNSPNVQAEGNVSITINDKKGHENYNSKQSIRVSFFRSKGISNTFLSRGMLSPKWEKILGNQSEIVRNTTFLEFQKLENLFSDGPFGDIIYSPDGHPNISTLYEISHNANLPGSWHSFLGGREKYSILIPDIEAAEVVFHTAEWPDNYGVFYRSHGTDLNGNEQYFPYIWRNVTPDDIENYERRIKQYYDVVKDRCGVCYGFEYDLSQAKRIMRGLRYIFESGLPEGFLTVFGQTGVHGGWGTHTVLRNLELEFVVIENIATQNIQIGRLAYRSLNVKPADIYDKVSEKFTSQDLDYDEILPAKFLTPGEKIVIPLRVNFVRPNWSLFAKSKIPSYKEIIDNPFIQKKGKFTDIYHPNFVEPYSRRMFLFSKKEEYIKRFEAPYAPERFTFGPAQQIVSLDVNNEEVPIRTADWRSFNLFLGSEKGSCPFVFTRSPKSRNWFNEGHVLYGATKPNLMRTDQMKLSRFDGGIIIKELEDELAYIKDVSIKIIRDGITVFQEKMEIQENDRYVYRGRDLNIDFNYDNISEDDKVYLSVTGFYINLFDVDIQRELSMLPR